MKTTFKIFVIFLVVFMFSCSCVKAFDLFLNSNTSNTSNNQANDLVETENNTNSENITIERPDDNTYVSNNAVAGNNDFVVTSLDSAKTTSTPTITTTQADNSLSTSDIINIILIAVCVVLIFLAIAILIRCK